MCPSLRCVLLLIPQEGWKQRCAALAQSAEEQFVLAIPMNLRAQHIGVIWSAFVCLGSLRHPLVCWVGRGSRGGSVMGESHHLQPTFSCTCGTGKWHLEHKRLCFPQLWQEAVAGQPSLQTSLTSEVPANVSSLSFCPPLLSPPGVSDSLCAHLTDLRAQWCPSTCSTPKWFVLLDSPRDYKDHDLLAIKLNRSSQRPKMPFANPSQCLNAGLGIWHIYPFVRCFSGSSWTSPVWK